MISAKTPLTAKGKFLLQLKKEFSRQLPDNGKILSVTEIEHLPPPVQKYLVYTGAVGKSKPRNMCIGFDAEMFRKPGEEPMRASSWQYNFFDRYSRIFLMSARKMFIPFSALHIYSDLQASFVVRVGGVFKVVDLSGDALTKAETVTFLNDLCLFAPGGLADERLSWRETDSLTARVTLVNGPYEVSADLFFNQQGQLINFVSDDRSALQDDGTLRQARWSTPVRDYREVNGRMVPTYGETIWHYPEGDFVYGKFRFKNIGYDVNGL